MPITQGMGYVYWFFTGNLGVPTKVKSNRPLV